ncbi:MerC domain-containing protein [Tautonia sociabilis]|uniref:MerC domain-containing protein n=1 Tax=Tautonia sociabilis TaxID=2080755 RepID=A0A432MDJ2_9BACT|nr:MerC domain-containing protein [Tautonia sociabilis]RUL82794.1 MerC domain-containing protein [Tautonia sociabilis]
MSLAALRPSIDRIGVALSASCAVHCLLTPLLLAVSSAGLLSWLADERLELGLIAAALLIGVIGIGTGCVRHRRYGLIALPAVAIALIAASRLLEESPAETALVVVGGLTLAAAHVVNLYFCRRCESCSPVASSGFDPESGVA